MEQVKIVLPEKFRTFMEIAADEDRPFLNGVYVNVAKRRFEVCDGWQTYMLAFGERTLTGDEEDIAAVPGFVLRRETFIEFMKNVRLRVGEDVVVIVQTGTNPTFTMQMERKGQIRNALEFRPLVHGVDGDYPDMDAVLTDHGRIQETPERYVAFLGLEILKGLVAAMETSGDSVMRLEFRNEDGLVLAQTLTGYLSERGVISGGLMPMLCNEAIERRERHKEAVKLARLEGK